MGPKSFLWLFRRSGPLPRFSANLSGKLAEGALAPHGLKLATSGRLADPTMKKRRVVSAQSLEFRLRRRGRI